MDDSCTFCLLLQTTMQQNKNQIVCLSQYLIFVLGTRAHTGQSRSFIPLSREESINLTLIDRPLFLNTKITNLYFSYFLFKQTASFGKQT